MQIKLNVFILLILTLIIYSMFNLTETSKKRIINKHLKTICTCHSQTSDNNDSFITTDNICNYSNQIEKKEDIRFINTAEYLYTNQGNSHIPIDILMDRGLAPLTRWTQTEIYKHQNPTDCSKSIFLSLSSFIYL